MTHSYYTLEEEHPHTAKTIFYLRQKLFILPPLSRHYIAYLLKAVLLLGARREICSVVNFLQLVSAVV